MARYPKRSKAVSSRVVRQNVEQWILGVSRSATPRFSAGSGSEGLGRGALYKSEEDFSPPWDIRRATVSAREQLGFDSLSQAVPPRAHSCEERTSHFG
jgi:hypothetical protein